MVPLVAALSTSLAIVFMLLAFAGRRAASPTAERVEQLKAQIYPESQTAESFGARIALPVARGVGRAIMSVLPLSIVRNIEQGLTAAGRPMTPPGFILFSLLTAGMFGALTVAVVFRRLTVPTSVALVIVALSVVAGLAVMPLWLRRRIADRRTQIWRSLPDAADLLTTCVEAGMGIDAALVRVSREVRGPLQTELRAAMEEITLGKPRQAAFLDMGARAGVDDLLAMLGAIVQAEESGTSLGPVLRAQSRHIRNRRRLLAQERARAVPAKMVFPIVFLIVPTVFLLILGPLIVEITETFTAI